MRKTIALVLSVLMTLCAIPQNIAFAGENDDLAAVKALGASVTEYPADGVIRRPLSNEQPMWIIHIDSWNYPDPEKIIDLVPEDILPYVVFDISLSINWDSKEHKWLMVQDGYSTAKSWLRSCADRGVWAMIQPASGGQCHFPDYYDGSPDGNDIYGTVFEEFFREYPNFIGYNYCEQFWGFEQADFPISCPNRYRHFANLLELCNKYGGYLDISWCGNQWGPNINPLAMFKRVPEWGEACEKYHQNLIMEEKYTQVSYIHDRESLVYGYFVGGWCDNYGVRYDDTGWTDTDFKGLDGQKADDYKKEYRLSTALPIHIERMAMNGATVIDGPELIWVDDIQTLYDGTDSEGFAYRRFKTTTQFDNVMVDMFRKVLDKSIRIPDRKEAVSRTKFAVIQDITGRQQAFGDNLYSTYPTLFEGLYRMPDDGNLKDNYDPFKCTGRYQTIPTVYALRDDLAKSIPVQIKQSEIASRWASIADKQAEFNSYYPNDVESGNSFAARNENTWLEYNPYTNGTAAGSILKLKYNTCKTLDISHSAPYGTALVNEYSDRIDIYLNNFDQKTNELKTDTLTLKGAASRPSYTAKDRGSHQASVISESWEDGVYRLTVQHNGPLDLTINCRGNETGKETAYKQANLVSPDFPSFYTGTRQYEAENFDRKNVAENVTNGCRNDASGYEGMGYLKFGTRNNAVVKDTVKTANGGDFIFTLRYSAKTANNAVDLYVNGTKAKTLSLAAGKSYSDWQTVSETVSLKEGENRIELRANSTLPESVYFDNFKLDGVFGDPASVMIDGGDIADEVTVYDTEHSNAWEVKQNFSEGAKLFGDRDFTCAEVPRTLKGAEYIQTACEAKMLTKPLGSFKMIQDGSVYILLDKRVEGLLPDWLKNYEKTRFTVTTSGGHELIVYSRDLKAGDTVTLGQNSSTGNGNCVNYVVLAVKARGDVNNDGIRDKADARLVMQAALNGGLSDSYDFKAADMNVDDTVDLLDAVSILNNMTRKGTPLDLSTASAGTYKDGVLSINDQLAFTLKMPKTIKTGESVKVYVNAKDNGGTGFRAYLTGGADVAVSDIFKAEKIISDGVEFTLTSTNDNAGYILFKGPNYYTNMADITFEYIAVE